MKTFLTSILALMSISMMAAADTTYVNLAIGPSFVEEGNAFGERLSGAYGYENDYGLGAEVEGSIAAYHDSDGDIFAPAAHINVRFSPRFGEGVNPYVGAGIGTTYLVADPDSNLGGQENEQLTFSWQAFGGLQFGKVGVGLRYNRIENVAGVLDVNTATLEVGYKF